jgi:hypothetical protein
MRKKKFTIYSSAGFPLPFWVAASRTIKPPFGQYAQPSRVKTAAAIARQ